MKKLILFFLIDALSTFISPTFSQQKNVAQYVNPFVGTGGHGHTFPGATVPFGMVQLSPDTRIDGSWDGCSGYHYSDSTIYGFSHTHLSGTGCSDYGDIALLPFTEYKQGDYKNKLDFDYKKYAISFHHKNETASTGYYSVKMNNGIHVELTSTTRVGFHKYTFPANAETKMVVQIDHRDKTLESSLKIINNKTIEGFRRSEAWAKDQYIYFVMEYSEPFANENKIETIKNKALLNTGFYCLEFNQLNGKPLYVKVGVSNVSIDGARKNLQAELPHWDFNKVKKDAESLWNRALNKIEVTSTDKDELAIFYTALYHTMIQPNVAMDVDGKYRGRDNTIHVAQGFTYYSVFSLWDTFRGAHPLYTLIDQKRTADFINTFLAQYEQGGRLPVWELSSNETDCMIGYHAVSVIADAIAKGILGFNYEKAFAACKHSAMLDHLGLNAYKKNGAITMDDEHESVSKTLEYAYDDWCIAQIANQLNKKGDYIYFMNRSQSWKNVFDPESGFMRPKKNGGWLTPFDPKEVNNNFTEGNSWQYSFFVPQDVNGLIQKMGGPKKFNKKLDELFMTSNKTTGREQADITGLIGQYAHGNEPSHHMTYLYHFTGQTYKAQQRIHEVLSDFYKNDPNGLIGNEDCGQMSAWYVLSAMGFYQVTPGSEIFMLGTPAFSEVKINLENKKTFVIKSSNLSTNNFYVSTTNLNNKTHPFSSIAYHSILSGGHLDFMMAGKPNKELIYPNYSDKVLRNPILTVPIIQSVSRVFEDSLKIELLNYEEGTKVFYYLKETENLTPEITNNYLSPIEYKQPFYIYKNETITAYCQKEDGKGNKQLSNYSTARFYKRPNNWTITLKSTYNPQYTAGDDNGIIDGIHGETNWRKGEWQGYQSQNVECVVDLQKEVTIKKFSSSYLQDSRSWILMPTKVEYYTSIDNLNFSLASTIENDIEAEDNELRIKYFEAEISPQKVRFVKVVAYNAGKLPLWHQGAGGDAFIFIDEINIK